MRQILTPLLTFALLASPHARATEPKLSSYDYLTVENLEAPVSVAEVQAALTQVMSGLPTGNEEHLIFAAAIKDDVFGYRATSIDIREIWLKKTRAAHDAQIVENAIIDHLIDTNDLRDIFLYSALYLTNAAKSFGDIRPLLLNKLENALGNIDFELSRDHVTHERKVEVYAHLLEVLSQRHDVNLEFPDLIRAMAGEVFSTRRMEEEKRRAVPRAQLASVATALGTGAIAYFATHIGEPSAAHHLTYAIASGLAGGFVLSLTTVPYVRHKATTHGQRAFSEAAENVCEIHLAPHEEAEIQMRKVELKDE